MSKEQTPAELIAEHTKIKDFVAAQNAALSEHLKPHNERAQEIENKLLEMLNALNAGNSSGKKASFSTEHGTAYLSTIVTPKITDKTAFLDFVLEDWDARGGMLQIGNPQKDALQTYQDDHEGALPPHVTTDRFTRVNIRRT